MSRGLLCPGGLILVVAIRLADVNIGKYFELLNYCHINVSLFCSVGIVVAAGLVGVLGLSL